MTITMKITSILLLALSACLSWAATPDDWRTRSIYFVVTDRFARSDDSVTAPCNLTEAHYCGGSWQGLINRLDYIKDMGFTAVWITPITHNIEQTTSVGQAYHGYWQDDIYALNEHYGSASDLKALAQALHDRDMYFMADVVANHFAFAGGPNDVDYEAYQPFNSSSYFHSPCNIDNYDNQTQVEDCWLGYNTSVELTDLNTTQQAVKDLYYSWIQDLVQEYSIDGLRVDTVKHVNKDFWPGFNSASGVYNVGEVFISNVSYLCPYQDYMDGILNYIQYYPLTAAFQNTSGPISDLVDTVNTVKSTCKDSTLLGSFLENHDNPRFPSLTPDLALAKNAIGFGLLSDGIPILYYGQEQHFNGTNDPYDREALWLSNYSTTTEAGAPLYAYVAQLNQIRNLAIAHDQAFVRSSFDIVYNDTNTVATRRGNENKLVAVWSNLGSDGEAYSLSIPDTGFEGNSSVVEVLGCSTQMVGDDGAVEVAMGQGAPKVFYPAADLTGSGVCGM